MSEATVRELRNQGGRVLDRVVAGERVTITRDGKPVARLEPVGRDRLSAAVLVARFGRLPQMDPQRLRDDVDAIIDQRL
jgi:prevent-host-death family protein